LETGGQCEERMLLPNASVSSAVFISEEGHGRVTSTYLAPCTQGPLMITALLMALMMVLSIYWLILKWVAKGNLDLPTLSSISGMMPRVYTIGGSID